MSAPHDAVVQEVTKGVELKHTETVDKSTPQIDPAVTLKTVDRKGLVEGVTNPPELKHVDAVADRSDPKIDPNTHVKKNEHGALLAEVAAKAQEKSS